MTSSEGFQKHFSIISKVVCCDFYMKNNVAFTLTSFVVLKWDERLSVELMAFSCFRTSFPVLDWSRSSHCQDRPTLPFQEASGPCPDTPWGLKCWPRPDPTPNCGGSRLGVPEAGPRPGHTICYIDAINESLQWKLTLVCYIFRNGWPSRKIYLISLNSYKITHCGMEQK